MLVGAEMMMISHFVHAVGTESKDAENKDHRYRYRYTDCKKTEPPFLRRQYPGGLTRWLTRVHFGTSAPQSVSQPCVQENRE